MSYIIELANVRSIHRKDANIQPYNPKTLKTSIILQERLNLYIDLLWSLWLNFKLFGAKNVRLDFRSHVLLPLYTTSPLWHVFQ